MKTKLENAVVVITGASAGIGRACAYAFADKKAKIAILSRNPGRLSSLTKELQARGTQVIAVSIDVSDNRQVEDAVNRITQTLGPIDVWVNNAMVSVIAPVKDTEPDEYRRVMEVNFLGYVHGTLAALNQMRQRNKGVIVQVGSAVAYKAIPLQSAYSSSKYAIRAFTESLRAELMHEKSKIQIVMTELPAVNTPQFSWVRSKLPRSPQPIPPIYQPEVAAKAIVWSTLNPQRDIAIGTSSVLTILGSKIAPSLLERYLANKGYEKQMSSTPASKKRKDNLFESLDGNFGTKGTFTRFAKNYSWQFLIKKNKKPLTAVLSFFVALYAVYRYSKKTQ